MSRFSISPIIRAHWKGLTNGTGPDIRPDWPARYIFIVVPVGVAALTVVLGWQLSEPAPLLAGVSLLAGGLLGSFAQLSSLRLKVSEWTQHSADEWLVERELLDETAGHVLLAAMLCAIDAAVLVIAMNATVGGQRVAVGWSAGVLAISVYILLVFIVCLPRLYSAYVQINKVSDHLSGFAKGKWTR